MCNICIDDTKKLFVFPQDKEPIDEWLERLGEHDHLSLAMMYHTDDGLKEIAKSYSLQGFTHQENTILVDSQSEPFFNVLYIRDLVFITYGKRFQLKMGWSHESHV